MGQLGKIFNCYCLLSALNIGVFGYEVGIVGMTIDQSVVLRELTVVTDLVEAFLFVDSRFFKNLADQFVQKVSLPWGWASSGFRLALIGSIVYLMKLLIVDHFLLGSDAVSIGMEKTLFAFGISFALSFLWGVVADIPQEELMGRLRTAGMLRHLASFFGGRDHR